MTEQKNSKEWIREGGWFGIIMYLFMTVLYPLLISKPIETKNLIVGIPFWLIGGLAYGYINKLLNRK